MTTFNHSPVSSLIVGIASFSQCHITYIREQIITLSSARGPTCQAQLGLVFISAHKSWFKDKHATWVEMRIGCAGCTMHSEGQEIALKHFDRPFCHWTLFSFDVW